MPVVISVAIIVLLAEIAVYASHMNVTEEQKAKEEAAKTEEKLENSKIR